MMTTLSAMRMSLSMRSVRATIIGGVLLALLLLGGCSAMRVAYGQGPLLVYWWLDGYLNFTPEQSIKVKAGLADSFAWHRETQLDDYAVWLGSIRQQLAGDVTPAQVCELSEQAQARLQPVVRQLLPLAAGIAPTLGPEQLAQLRQRYAKTNAELRKEYLQPDRAERQKASIERAVDRFEDVYGRLDTRQRQLVADLVRASPFDAEAWLRDRQARQQDTLATLQRITAGSADSSRSLELLRAWAARLEGPNGPDSAAYRQRLARYNCDFAAQVHNATTPAQRRHAQDKVKGWEDDLRTLAGAAPTRTAGAAAAATVDATR
jgi:hypothetical protein